MIIIPPTVNPNAYALTETKTGERFHDGREIYQKTLEGPNFVVDNTFIDYGEV